MNLLFLVNNQLNQTPFFYLVYLFFISYYNSNTAYLSSNKTLFKEIQSSENKTCLSPIHQLFLFYALLLSPKQQTSIYIYFLLCLGFFKQVVKAFLSTIQTLMKNDFNAYSLCFLLLSNLFRFHIHSHSTHFSLLFQSLLDMIASFREITSLRQQLLDFLCELLDLVLQGILQHNCLLSGCSQTVDGMIQYFLSLLELPYTTQYQQSIILNHFSHLLFFLLISSYSSHNHNQLQNQNQRVEDASVIQYFCYDIPIDHFLCYYFHKDSPVITLFSMYSSLFDYIIQFNKQHSIYPILLSQTSFLLLLCQLCIALSSSQLHSLINQYTFILHSISTSLNFPLLPEIFSSYPLLALSSLLTAYQTNSFIGEHFEKVLVFWRDWIQQRKMKQTQLVAFYQQLLVLIHQNAGFFMDNPKFRKIFEILFPSFLTPQPNAFTEFVGVSLLPLIDRYPRWFDYGNHEIRMNAIKSTFYNILQSSHFPTIITILNAVRFGMFLYVCLTQ